LPSGSFTICWRAPKREDRVSEGGTDLVDLGRVEAGLAVEMSSATAHRGALSDWDAGPQDHAPPSSRTWREIRRLSRPARARAIDALP
jgi:hypothetical protein